VLLKGLDWGRVRVPQQPRWPFIATRITIDTFRATAAHQSFTSYGTCVSPITGQRKGTTRLLGDSERLEQSIKVGEIPFWDSYAVMSFQVAFPSGGSHCGFHRPIR
jgi:hypothetical protein